MHHLLSNYFAPFLLSSILQNVLPYSYSQHFHEQSKLAEENLPKSPLLHLLTCSATSVLHLLTGGFSLPCSPLPISAPCAQALSQPSWVSPTVLRDTLLKGHAVISLHPPVLLQLLPRVSGPFYRKHLESFLFLLFPPALPVSLKLQSGFFQSYLTSPLWTPVGKSCDNQLTYIWKGTWYTFSSKDSPVPVVLSRRPLLFSSALQAPLHQPDVWILGCLMRSPQIIPAPPQARFADFVQTHGPPILQRHPVYTCRPDFSSELPSL